MIDTMSGSTINAVPFRSTIFYTAAGVQAAPGTVFTVGTNGIQSTTNSLALNTLSVSTLSFQSTTISMGQSTNQNYTNFTSGAFTPALMTSTLSTYNSLSTVTKVSMSQDGRFQYALQSAPSTSAYYQLSRSSDTGVTWSTLNTSTMGLPQGSLAYQSTVSGYPTYSNFSQSATGQYALAATSGGQLYVSNNANSATPVYTPANVGGAPYAYLPMDSLPITDMMGNTTITVTGSVPLVAGKVGSAINLANTAGGMATNYVRGTWTGSANFTVSFWFYARTISVQQLIFGAFNNNFQIYIGGNNTLYLNYNGANLTPFAGIALNTWYNVVAIFNASGIGSFYVNNSLIGTYSCGTTAGISTGLFSLGTYDAATSFAFNGYIDDFYIYNFAAPNVIPPFIYLSLDGTLVDAMGNTSVTPFGSPGYVAGAPVGTRTLSLANTAGGTAVQYVRGSWTYLNNFTVSGWVNFKGIASPGYQIIYSSHNTIILFYVNPSNQIVVQLPSGTGAGFTLITTTFPIITNTWYYLTMIFQINGLCSFYVNNSLIGSFTNSGGYGTVTSSGLFSIGTYDTTTTYAFSGYVDDFKIYNYAVSVSPIAPLNWSHTAVSATGQYMMAAAAAGGVFCSTNYGASWSQLTTTQISSLVSPGGTAKTLMGPLIQPNTPLATSATWTINGVTWTTIASSSYAGYNPYKVFDNSIVLTSGSWNTATAAYTTTGNSSGYNTTVQGIGSIQGEWLQIQSSIPLVMYSYQFSLGGGPQQFPNTFYIIGSNDATTWFPIQRSIGASQTNTAGWNLIPGTIIIATSGSQTFGNSTLATTVYSTTTNAYIYFRLIGVNSYGTNTYLEIGEWFVNFSTPMPLLTAPATAPSTATSAVTVMPQMTNLAAANWTTPNGVSWKASASTENASYPAYKAFNNANPVNTDKWESFAATYTGSVYSAGAYSTSIQTIGSVGGEWLQIQSSVPLVLTSYSLGTADVIGRMSKTYYIVGSNDANTWYPIQYCNFTSTPFNAAYSATSYINANFSGTQTVTAGTTGSATTTSYSTSTSAYTYFRMITTNLYSPETIIDVGEWFVNFTAYTPNPVNALAISNGGQNMLVAATGTTMPNVVGVTPAAITTWTANGITWTASGLYLSSPYFPYYAFNNSLGPNSWASSSTAYTTTPLTTGTTTSVSGIGTVYGDYLQLQSSVPIVMYSYQFATGSDAAIYFVKTFYIVGSNDGLTWYPIQYGNANSTQPTSSTATLIQNMIYVNSAGAQPFGNSILTTTTYSTTTNAYTYFRLIPTATFNSSANVVQIGEWYTHFQAGATYLSTNYGSTWSTVCTAPPNAPSLATSGNGQYTITGTGQLATVYSNAALTTYTIPTLTGINANINCASISSTGQYMIILTQGTTNNVFYSTNFGITFTGMTVGTAAMTSCAISYDGFEITVSNASNVYTLNRNTQGYSITMGNQSGVTSQGYNSIAIGNLAGVLNQSANSIILNASGSILDAYNPGFFVSPVQSQLTANHSSVALLGYGADNQIVQTALTLRADGSLNPFNVNSTGTMAIASLVGFTSNIGIGTTVPGAPLHIYAPQSTVWPFLMSYSSGPQLVIGNGAGYNIIMDTYNTVTGGRPPLCLNTSGGFVGIGFASPSYNLDILGAEPTLRIRTSTNAYNNGTATLLFDSTTGAYPFGKIVGYDAQTSPGQTYLGGLQFYTNLNTALTKRMTIDHNGTIFFHGYTSGGTLNATATTGQLTLSSDIRIKDSIVYLNDTSSALNQINHIRPATFRLIGQDDMYLGFIAQDVEKYIPLAVDGKKYEYQWELDENGKPKFDADGNIVYLLDRNGDKIIRPRGLDDRAIIATQTLAIQELSKQANSSAAQIQELLEKATSQASLVQELAGKTSQLEAENTQLKSQLAALEARLAAAGF